MAKTEKFSYDKAMAEIEAIVEQLERHDSTTSFDEMIDNVERALRLVDNCKKNIANAESRLAKLTEKAEDGGL